MQRGNSVAVGGTVGGPPSDRYVVCLGMPSQQTPNIPHFLAVLKYIGPGWKGL